MTGAVGLADLAVAPSCLHALLARRSAPSIREGVQPESSRSAFVVVVAVLLLTLRLLGLLPLSLCCFLLAAVEGLREPGSLTEENESAVESAVIEAFTKEIGSKGVSGSG